MRGRCDRKGVKGSGEEGGKVGREMQGRREELMWEEREGKGKRVQRRDADRMERQ
jgi:hypothetical protein